MSIEHKAWLFDHDRFIAELAGPLHAALDSGDAGVLHPFLPSGERPADVQACADAALAAYTDLDDEMGLGYRFDALLAYLRGAPALEDCAQRLIEGAPVGPPHRLLDPGLMGTGMVGTREAAELLARLREVRGSLPAIPPPDSEVFADCIYPPDSTNAVEQALAALIDIYERAVRARRGILFADFRE